MKVYELAKEVGLESKDILQILKELNIDIKSHMSNLEEDHIIAIKEHMGVQDEIKKQELQGEILEEETMHTSKPWTPDLNRMICIRNISRGRLIYKSKRQIGYKVVWEESGDINHLELSELINLRNTDHRMFSEPWIRIEEDDEYEILKYLHVLKFYEAILGTNNVTDILSLDFTEFKNKFDRLPKGYKETLAEAAARMIQNGALDSIRTKSYIEEQMNIDLDLLIQSPKTFDDDRFVTLK